MKRILLPVLCVVLAACSSSQKPSKPVAEANELLAPVAAGAKVFDGALTIASVTPLPGGPGHAVVLRAGPANVNAFVLLRWFGNESLKREFRVESGGWLPLRIEAGKEVTLQARSPYAFAMTLGLDFAKTKPAAISGEGKALPGRLVVTPEQAAKLKLYAYPDLELTQYESRKHPTAPKLAVWRDAKGKVVAAMEIHVRKDAKPVGGGVKFLHTNGKKEIGSSLVHSNTKLGQPGETWDFVVFQQGDAREVALPWKPLVKNASYIGTCAGGAMGLDAGLLGKSVELVSFEGANQVASESAALESPSWSMANPTAGSLSSGAPVECEYSGPRAQRWSVTTDSDMTFTGAGGAA